MDKLQFLIFIRDRPTRDGDKQLNIGLHAFTGLVFWFLLEHSNSGKKVSIRFDTIFATESIFSIRFGNLIDLPLVHRYSSSKLGVIFIVCIA